MLCSNPFLKEVTDLVKVPLPCGQCLHCRINQARVWQTRLILESQISYDSAFITLTYDDEHLPQGNTLVRKHLTDFFKRYRKRWEPHKIRYYAIGEYGHEGTRGWNPHYHIALFTPAPIERCYRICKEMRSINSKHGSLCTNDCYLALSWPYGNVEVSRTLGSENAGYITGYIKKKATKEYRDGLQGRVPEFATMSRGRTDPITKIKTGGIGYEAIRRIAEKFKAIKRDYRGPTIRRLNQGTSSRPIGQYLTNELCSELGIDESARQREFIIYANQIFCEIHEGGDIEGRVPEPGELRQNYLALTEGKRNSIEVKAKHFQRKRKTL